MAVRNRLVQLLSEKQAKENRIITIPQFAKESGIARQTLYPYLRENAALSSFRADVIERLCKYFQCTVGDILYVDYGDQQPEAQR